VDDGFVFDRVVALDGHTPAHTVLDAWFQLAVRQVDQLLIRTGVERGKPAHGLFADPGNAGLDLAQPPRVGSQRRRRFAARESGCLAQFLEFGALARLARGGLPSPRHGLFVVPQRPWGSAPFVGRLRQQLAADQCWTRPVTASEDLFAEEPQSAEGPVDATP
jgi:hypothetical protein